MIGIVCAMEEEASDIIETFALENKETMPFQIYQQDAIVLIISKIGKVYAALATNYLICQYHPDVIVNIGLAGKINHALHTGDVFLVREVFQHDVDIPDSFCPAYLKESLPCFIPPEMKNLKAVSLVTGDQFVHDHKTVSRLSHVGDIVDMEGYSVALTAKIYSIPCILVKGISDDADMNAMSTMMQNLHIVMHKSISFLRTLKNSYEKN